MLEAVALGESVRGTTSPNPWVGAIVLAGADRFSGVTQPPGGSHAEAMALAAAGAGASGATLVCTLEPCDHVGRTPPCTEAIVAAGVRRVVIGVEDPDPRVGGRGIAHLRAHGIEVVVGTEAAAVEESLIAYLTHRRTGRPFVVLKLATTLDGRIAAPDGSSRWVTGEEARADVHRLRSRSDAVAVGAGTLRSDDPSLSARQPGAAGRQPLRVVFGRAPDTARAQPVVELVGPLEECLAELGRRGVLELLVEGGARLAHDLHGAGLVDRYVFYVAPVLLGGSDGVPVMAGTGAATMALAWRGRLRSLTRLGADARIEVDRP